MSLTTWLRALVRRAVPPQTQLHAPVPWGGGGRVALPWTTVIREPFTGAWQRNMEVSADSVLSYGPVYACVTLIASDIAKVRLRLVQQDDLGIWTETTNPAYSPVLRRPNHYQLIGAFIEQWILSKLIWGNAYVLKARDARGVVVGLYVLNPMRVQVLIATDGSIYYSLQRDDLSELPTGGIVVPAREIIHDPMVPLYHPLVGVTPIYACGSAAVQGLTMQKNSRQFFANGSQPGGVLMAPGAIGDDAVKRMQAYWRDQFSGDNVGKIAVLADGLKYEPMSVNAVDAALVAQLNWTAETVCACYHVPAYMIGVGSPPTMSTGVVEVLTQQYYAQCLQSLVTNMERHLDDGLGIYDPIRGVQYGTEFDVDDLIWMDTDSRGSAAEKGIGSGALSPNEARLKYYALGPVEGGDSPMVQQQYYSLAALAERDASKPFVRPVPATPPEAVQRDTIGALVVRRMRERAA